MSFCKKKINELANSFPVSFLTIFWRGHTIPPMLATFSHALFSLNFHSLYIPSSHLNFTHLPRINFLPWSLSQEFQFYFYLLYKQPFVPVCKLTIINLSILFIIVIHSIYWNKIEHTLRERDYITILLYPYIAYHNATQ